MRALKDYSNIVVRYDLLDEKEQDTSGGEKLNDESMQQVMDCIVKGNKDGITDAINAALEGNDPLDVIDVAVDAMDEVGRLWDEGTYFLPQVINSADIMLEALDICEGEMGTARESKGVIVAHVPEGDIHDLGKNIVTALLQANGFEVIDLGVDVPSEEVVEAVKEHDPIMISGTALMTTTMSGFEKTANLLLEEGLEVPLVCGGGAVSGEYMGGIDLGIYGGDDATKAAPMARDAAAGASWKEIREKYNS